jgi:hypothetical protein
MGGGDQERSRQRWHDRRVAFWQLENLDRHAADIDAARQIRSARKRVAEMYRRESDSWARIVSALGGPEPAERARVALLRAAVNWMLSREEDIRLTAARRRRCAKIATLARSLDTEIKADYFWLRDSIESEGSSSYVWGLLSNEPRSPLVLFADAVEKVSSYEVDGGRPSKEARRLAWSRVAKAYERATGRPARVTKGRGSEPSGPFVRLIRAFSEPAGERVTGYMVEEFVDWYRDQGGESPTK